MKNRLLTFLFLILAAAAHCQNTIITGTLTVTNQISNGWTFSVNGHLRTITNLVSNPANQILTNTTEAGCATNLFNSFIAYPETSPYLIISMPASNVIQFQTLSSLSPALTFSTNWPTTLPPGGPAPPASYWAVWTYSTFNLTNEIVVRLPTNGISLYEKTNVDNGFVQLFNDPGVTNSFLPGGTGIFRQFLSTNFGNQLGTALTNYSSNIVLRASNSIITWSSNFTWIEATNATNFTYQWAGILATNNTNFTLFASNALYGLLPAPGSFFPWQDGSQNVLITNEFGIPRIRAQQNGGMIGGVLDMLESDGATEFFYNDASGDTFLMDRNYGGANRRLEIDDQASGSSNAYLRGGLGANLAYNGPNIGSGPPTGAGIAIGGGQGTLFAGRPLVFQNVTGTTTSSGAVAIGTLTNFASVQVTSDTIYNTFSLQGDCMTNNGDAVIRDIGMTFATGSSYSVDMEFNGQVIFATGSFNSISGAMSLRCGVTTDASGNFHYNCMATGSGLSTNTFASVGHHSWNTATATNFYINVIAYVGSDDITVESDNTKLAPGAKWNSLP